MPSLGNRGKDRCSPSAERRGHGEGGSGGSACGEVARLAVQSLVRTPLWVGDAPGGRGPGPSLPPCTRLVPGSVEGVRERSSDSGQRAPERRKPPSAGCVIWGRRCTGAGGDPAHPHRRAREEGAGMITHPSGCAGTGRPACSGTGSRQGRAPCMRPVLPRGVGQMALGGGP